MSSEALDSLLRSWLPPLLSAALALIVVVIAWRVCVALLHRLTRSRPVARLFLESAEGLSLATVALVALELVMQSAPNNLVGIDALRHLNSLALITAATWLAVRLFGAVADAVAVLYPANVRDNLLARRIQTQTRLLTRALASAAVLVGIACALLTFPSVRSVGASLLASAGIAGLVVGIAARPIVGNLLAGLQIALTQPIRLDDVVVVEGEWGRIEEIGRAFVTIALWDQRRLVVPLQYFVEKPFQNWTRNSSEILGTVFLWVDYGMPVDPLRAELRRICEAAEDWDRRTCLLQVTDASERTMQLRALVSAVDSDRAFDLRCLVREGLIDFVRREYPQFLPRLRAELTRGSGRRGSGAQSG
jgi:small-conductance mechanosensitive channel